MVDVNDPIPEETGKLLGELDGIEEALSHIMELSPLVLGRLIYRLSRIQIKLAKDAVFARDAAEPVDSGRIGSITLKREELETALRVAIRMFYPHQFLSKDKDGLEEERAISSAITHLERGGLRFDYGDGPTDSFGRRYVKCTECKVCYTTPDRNLCLECEMKKDGRI